MTTKKKPAKKTAAKKAPQKPLTRDTVDRIARERDEVQQLQFDAKLSALESALNGKLSNVDLFGTRQNSLQTAGKVAAIDNRVDGLIHMVKDLPKRLDMQDGRLENVMAMVREEINKSLSALNVKAAELDSEVSRLSRAMYIVKRRLDVQDEPMQAKTEPIAPGERPQFTHVRHLSVYAVRVRGLNGQEYTHTVAADYHVEAATKAVAASSDGAVAVDITATGTIIV